MFAAFWLRYTAEKLDVIVDYCAAAQEFHDATVDCFPVGPCARK